MTLEHAARLSVLVVSLGCHRAPRQLPSTGLTVEAEVAPRVLSTRSLSDSLRVTVIVTNPTSTRVAVSLGGPPYRTGQIPAAETIGAGFGVRVLREDSGKGPSGWTWGEPIITFGPRGSRRYTFTIPVVRDLNPRGLVLPGAGRYRVASFGRQEAAPVIVTVEE